ncbi:MAG: molybdopterin-guanine dinucleotide biosynthesis protein MobB, partial [Burkholderiaceae bacterium]|nr:molybdopterin-guanine dinucleotide biosynthesis protein MobB [Burkholderiaceae bacterium]
WRTPQPQQAHRAVLYPHDALVAAVATDLPDSLPVPTELPVLDLNAPEQVADWLLQHQSRFDYRPEAAGASEKHATPLPPGPP